MWTRLRAFAATAVVVGCAVMLAPVPGHANAKVALQVTPRVAMEPATVTIRATVEPHADNRGLAIDVMSEGHSQRSFVQLEGRDAPRTTMATFAAVPAGVYEVTTKVIGPGGKVRATAVMEITVMSRFGG